MANVFLNGCFDVIHIGHFNMLMFARQLAGPTGRVIVALDEDEKVMADKGLQRPIFDVHERAKTVSEIKFLNKQLVDEIHLFHTNLELSMLIKRLRPNIIMKGSDWKGKFVVGEDVAKVVFYDRMEEHSTSEIIRRILEKHNVK